MIKYLQVINQNMELTEETKYILNYMKEFKRSEMNKMRYNLKSNKWINTFEVINIEDAKSETYFCDADNETNKIVLKPLKSDFE